MNKFIIDKSFNFAYGHRVWVQHLRKDFCAEGDTGTKCRWLHGHEGLVRVFVESEHLNPQSMVCDFKELGFVKDFLDNNIDHKFIIDINDPLFENIINGKHTKVSCVEEKDNYFHGVLIPTLRINKDTALLFEQIKMPGTDHVVGHKLDVSSLEGTEKEFYESFFIVDFVPTSENLSKWLFNAVSSKLQLINVKVNQIEWNETPKSRSVYINNNNQ